MLQRLTFLLTLVVFALQNWHCGDGECTKKPDLVIPQFVSGQVQVAYETRYTVVGGFDYPYGGPVFLTNTINEFYSVVRTNPQTGGPLVFYWNVHSPPPFYSNAPPPYNWLEEGEEVTVHRCVYNKAFPDIDCLTKSAQPSKTQLDVYIKVENGKIVDTQRKEALTPEIPAGQYRVVSFPIKFSYTGVYDLEFTANADNSVEESDTTNNKYVDRGKVNLGTGE